jgi:hypothetical protein
VTKWGSDWADQWAEIQESLDSGWADRSTGDKADALIELVSPSVPADVEEAEVETPADAGEAESVAPAPAREAGAAPVDLSDKPWIRSLVEAASFEDWLIAVGVKADLVPGNSFIKNLNKPSKSD